MKYGPIVLILFLAVLAGSALLQTGLPPTHDGEYHIIRFYQFDKTLRDGDFYPRWQADLNKGYGSPLLNYYYPLPNYMASLLHFLGTSFIDAFKMQMFIAILVGALFMYLWGAIFWGSWGGVIASIFYTYSPYHFLDIYIRGSAGEVWSLALFPAFLWSATRLITEKKLFFLPIAAVFLALIIFSHNILAMVFLPFTISYLTFLIIQTKQKRYAIIVALVVALLALGFSSIFWLPALLERHFVQGLEIFDYRRHFVETYQLIFPSWGSGFSADPTTEGLSLQIGIANLMVLFLSFILTLLFKKKYKREIKLVIFLLIWAIISIFLMLKVSYFLWEALSLPRYVQFPWRFLSIIILCCAFIAGSIVYCWQKRFVVLTLIALPIVLGIGYSKPAYYHLRDDAYYITRANFIDGTNVPGNSFNTIWFNPALRREKEKIKFVKGRGEIKTYAIGATDYKFSIVAEQDSELLVNTAYFPGWTAFINNDKKELFPNKDGLIAFSVPAGQYLVEVKLADTTPRTIGKILSFTSLVIIAFLLVKSIRVRIKL